MLVPKSIYEPISLVELQAKEPPKGATWKMPIWKICRTLDAKQDRQYQGAEPSSCMWVAL